MKHLTLFTFLFFSIHFYPLDEDTCYILDPKFTLVRYQLIKQLKKEECRYLKELILSCKTWKKEIYNFFSSEGIEALKEYRPYLDQQDQDRYRKNNLLLLSLATSSVYNYYALKIIMNRLMQSEIYIDIRDNQFFTPLLLAVQAGNQMLTKLLIQADANIYFKTKYQDTALHFASKDGRHKITEYLLYRSNNTYINLTNIYGRTALHYAAYYGHKKLVCQLLKAGANKYITDNRGYTPLHIATKKNRFRTVLALLHAGATKYISIKDISGRTPLHYAAENGNTEILKVLLAYNIHINIQDNFSRTPIFLAANNPHSHAIRLLLEAGTYAHIAEKCKLLTALHIAACNGQDDIVTLLLQHGAPVNAKTRNLYTSLDYAVENNHSNCIKSLKRNGGKRSEGSIIRVLLRDLHKLCYTLMTTL